MEEEKKTEVSENKKKQISLSLSERVLNSAFAILALIVLAFTKILVNFGLFSGIFVGIMSIIVFALALVGVVWNLLKYKKANIEFIFSAGVAFLVFTVL